MNARKGKTKPFKKRGDFRHNDTKPVHPGFSPEPNKGQGMGSPTGKDPLIPLLQELRDRKDSLNRKSRPPTEDRSACGTRA